MLKAGSRYSFPNFVFEMNGVESVYTNRIDHNYINICRYCCCNDELLEYDSDLFGIGGIFDVTNMQCRT